MDSKLTDAENALTSRLALLQRSLDQMHGRTFPRGAAPSHPPLCVVGLPEPKRREARLTNLLQGVFHHAGIQNNDALRGKLERLLDEGHEVTWLLRLADDENLASDRESWQFLIEKLTVHETYFYRDGSQMEMVRREVIAPLLVREMGRAYPKVRLWSAAASTGEEPYTLAMMVVLELLKLNEARSVGGEIRINPRWAVEVVGSDISEGALRRGKAGSYAQVRGALSPFRELPSEFKQFFDFSETAQGHCGVVKPWLRQLVTFKQHNLTAVQPPVESVDVVFCRNVLIYFDSNTRKKVQHHVGLALQKGGVLVLGPSDVNLLPEQFIPRWGEKSVYYTKV